MRTVTGLQNLPAPLKRSVVSIGNFDGLHRGHREILRRGRELARSRDAPLVAVTFEPHPLRLVAPQRAPATLTPLHEKLRCLQEADVDLALVLAGDRQLLGMSARSFIEELVMPALHPIHMVEGRSFGFGRGRSGNVDTLAGIGRELGFEVVVVEPVEFAEDANPERISSSLVRRLIAEARVEPANRCLGRRYTLFGTVVTGKRRGRQLGFPTINLEVGDQLVPGEGVYSGLAIPGGQADRSRPAAVSIGHTPTFEDAGLKIEAFLLDYQGDLIGETVRLEFVGHVREQRRFDSPDELVAQIRRDVEQVRTQTAACDPAPGAPVES